MAKAYVPSECSGVIFFTATFGKLFGGGLMVGWGLFNMVEGVINHQILKLHNVMEFSSNHDIGNFIFLGVSLLMLGIGYLIIQGRNK